MKDNVILPAPSPPLSFGLGGRRMKFYGCRPLARPMLDNKIEPSVFHKYLMSVPDTSAAWHRLERTNWMYMQTTYLRTQVHILERITCLLYFVCTIQLACTNASLLVRTTDKGSIYKFTIYKFPVSKFSVLQILFSKFWFPIFSFTNSVSKIFSFTNSQFPNSRFYKYCFPNFGFQFSVLQIRFPIFSFQISSFQYTFL